MITVEAGAASSAGRVRSLNEDDFLCDPPVFVVADGMGGHAAGEVASRIAVDAFRTLVGRSSLTPSDVRTAVNEAQDQIVFKAQQNAEQRGMGTTITGVIAVESGGLDHWLVFNLGDSRVYRLHAGRLEQLSTDHSEVQELVGAGRITTAEARSHPRRNVVTRSLGGVGIPQPDLWLLPPSLGERYLLCSDGLVDELEDQALALELQRPVSAQEAADRLVAGAVAAGGRDNVTVVVVDVVGVEDTGADEVTVPRAALA